MTKKDNLDIDFDEIMDDWEELDKLTTPPPPAPLGLSVAIRYGNHYLMKDLAHLTDEEMLDWMSQVLPVINKDEYKSEDFRTRHQRAQVFDQVVDFYSRPIFPKTDQIIEETKKEE